MVWLFYLFSFLYCETFFSFQSPVDYFLATALFYCKAIFSFHLFLSNFPPGLCIARACKNGYHKNIKKSEKNIVLKENLCDLVKKGFPFWQRFFIRRNQVNDVKTEQRKNIETTNKKILKINLAQIFLISVDNHVQVFIGADTEFSCRSQEVHDKTYQKCNNGILLAVYNTPIKNNILDFRRFF